MNNFIYSIVNKNGQLYLGIGTKLLEDNNTKISMGKCAQENAYAERINLTIKDEYLKYKKMPTYEELVLENKKAIMNYNSKRLHNNLGRLTPLQFLNQSLNKELIPKPKLKIHDYQNNNQLIKK